MNDPTSRVICQFTASQSLVVSVVYWTKHQPGKS